MVASLTEQEAHIQRDAIEYARRHKKAIAKRIAATELYPAERDPVSVFMAGSPGAGKTEASKALIEQLNTQVLRIDPDELRSEFNTYNGGNAWLFQGAVSILVEKIHDLALNQKQSFILDGTLSNYEKSYANIERSLSKNRFVQILYVYQEPIFAWKFVQARELAEGRRIKKEDFIKQYFEARIVVNRLKKEFGGRIQVDLLQKNLDNSKRLYKAGVDQIDHHIQEKYTAADISIQIDQIESQ